MPPLHRQLLILQLTEPAHPAAPGPGGAPAPAAGRRAARRWLWAALALNAAYGALQGWATASGGALARAGDFAYALLLLPLPYLWLRADAAARSQRRSLALSGAAIYLPWLAVPWYVLRSRPRGQRARAVLKALAFGLLAMPAAYLLGGAPLALWRGGW